MEQKIPYSASSLTSKGKLKWLTPLLGNKLGDLYMDFVRACGKSNPLSFLLRSLAAHPKITVGVGGMLIFMTGMGTLLSPFESPILSNPDTGGPVGEFLLTSTTNAEPSIKTTLAVRLPMDNIQISQKFWALHSGIDMRNPIGTPIWAVMSGRVIKAERNSGGYGNLIIIDHGYGYETWYAHLSKFKVVVGELVDTNTVIGEVGSTGRSTGPHLHFELRENGRVVNPASLLGIKNEGPTGAILATK